MLNSLPARALILLLAVPLALPVTSAGGVGGGCVAVDVWNHGEFGTLGLTPAANAVGLTVGAGTKDHGVTVSVVVAPTNCVQTPDAPQTLVPAEDLTTNVAETRFPALP